MEKYALAQLDQKTERANEPRNLSAPLRTRRNFTGNGETKSQPVQRSPWIVHKGNSQSIHSMATINLSELKTQPTLDQCSCLGQRFVTQGGFRVFSASDLMDFGFRSAPGGPLKTLRLAWLGLRLWFILSQACQAIGAACLPVVVADGADNRPWAEMS